MQEVIITLHKFIDGLIKILMEDNCKKLSIYPNEGRDRTYILSGFSISIDQGIICHCVGWDSLRYHIRKQLANFIEGKDLEAGLYEN